MAIIKGTIDPHWHESNLLIALLNKCGPMQKSELFECIREQQKAMFVLGEKGVTHSKSAYRYWVRARKKQGIITECDGMLQLTPLGYWIVNSKLGTLSERDNFIANFLCPSCMKSSELVLLKPRTDTAETNAKGRMFMDIECRRCNYTQKRSAVSDVPATDNFISFYNQASTELRKTIRIMGQLLTPRDMDRQSEP